ncbi:Uncharacterised protein [Serratia entomophila]|nr:Uncharacterised protein [Serratia entomophila]CAI0965542.1 Uncharacterised protein [Serratia entomophila]CAI1599975.1 Uncharacterised protein [Serratia entomophila]
MANHRTLNFKLSCISFALDCVFKQANNRITDTVLQLTSAQDPHRLTSCCLDKQTSHSPRLSATSTALSDLIAMRIDERLEDRVNRCHLPNRVLIGDVSIWIAPPPGPVSSMICLSSPVNFALPRVAATAAEDCGVSAVKAACRASSSSAKSESTVTLWRSLISPLNPATLRAILGLLSNLLACTCIASGFMFSAAYDDRYASEALPVSMYA